jgi:hypothetical protein
VTPSGSSQSFGFDDLEGIGLDILDVFSSKKADGNHMEIKFQRLGGYGNDGNHICLIWT